MKASKANPVYTASVVADGVKYNISPAVQEISLSDRDRQIAQCATIQLAQQKIGDRWLSSLLKVRSRVYITANDGERNEEVFRGYIWTTTYRSQNDGKSLAIKCYDNLIYFQESEESQFFASGKSTKDVISSICSKWGVELDYSYSSITHGKLALRGALSDIITSDVLDLAKDRTGKKYVVRSEKDTIKVMTVGQNTTIYNIRSKENAISTASTNTMDGMTTKVVILGKADDNDRRPVEATVTDGTAEYGTLQKIITRDEDTSLADAKKEAQSILKENSKPQWEGEVEAVDIPWIRKGDKVQLSAGDMVNYYIVKSAEHNITGQSKTMSLTIENV